MDNALLEMKNISKEFPGVKALDNVSLTVRRGTVHALMGENGAGKSTLMKCLFGMYSLDGGQILLEGEEVKKYDISIEKVLSNRIDGKNMIVRITDKRLLEITGGIIQGMSGSPILQNGKLAGAVTHVFINDPSRGYGVFIENMLLEADVFTKNNKQALEYYSQGLFIYPHSWTSLALYRFN